LFHSSHCSFGARFLHFSRYSFPYFYRCLFCDRIFIFLFPHGFPLYSFPLLYFYPSYIVHYTLPLGFCFFLFFSPIFSFLFPPPFFLSFLFFIPFSPFFLSYFPLHTLNLFASLFPYCVCYLPVLVLYIC